MVALAPRKIAPNPGPQTVALQSDADLLIYGGAAGGGKSVMLLMSPLQYCIGEDAKPGFRGVYFRRSIPQIRGSGGLWEEARKLYNGLGAKFRGGSVMDVQFPQDATLEFRHLQHEDTKYDHQGKQYAAAFFDELCHFTETQFFYILSRLRTLCGIRPYARASCNPEPGWVADFISWWIDDESGYPIPERSGIVRWFIRAHTEDGEKVVWGDTAEELTEQHPGTIPMSATFVPASLDDNPVLTEADPGYKARLMSLPHIERMRLLKGNWKVTEGTQINPKWIREYTYSNQLFQFFRNGNRLDINEYHVKRFATIDTAGTSKEKAAQKRGKAASYSAMAIWDYHGQTDTLFLRHVWRAQVGWMDLKQRVPEVLKTWGSPPAFIENKHFGPALAEEVSKAGLKAKQIPAQMPKTDDTSRGAKLERAVASGMLARWEDGRLLVPHNRTELAWWADYSAELLAWTGLPDEVSDQIDVTSYGSWCAVHEMKAPPGRPIVARNGRAVA